MKIVIVGGPKTGKTTFAKKLSSDTEIVPVRHTDDVISLGWSEGSAEVATWFDKPGSWIVEGVAAVRALRKWLDAHRDGKPCDVVKMMLTGPFGTPTKAQAAMTKGHNTVWAEIENDLRDRGVRIERVNL